MTVFTKKSKTSGSYNTSVVFLQTYPSIKYLSLFLSGLCSPCLGTAYKLSTNGPISSIEVFGREIIGLPVMGSTSSVYSAAPTHSPLTKFIAFVAGLKSYGSRVAKACKCFDMFLAYRSHKDLRKAAKRALYAFVNIS